MKTSINICWFRRDLRLDDNTALFHALKSKLPVLPIFIFDKSILDKLSDKEDKRVNFIHICLQNIQNELATIGSDMEVLFDSPLTAFQKLTENHD
jgi:deoxyribodipyrimidine photo-lyase